MRATGRLSSKRKHPVIRECCLCGSNDPDEIYCLEWRPTAGKGYLQLWGYCRICAPQYFETEDHFVWDIPPRPPKHIAAEIPAPLSDKIDNADELVEWHTDN